MDGKGCWRDNVFVERLWRSVKYEEVYLKAYDSVSAARAGIAKYLNFYNTNRPHSAHGRDRHRVGGAVAAEREVQTFKRLVARRLMKTKAVVAIARELAGFVWAIGREVQRSGWKGVALEAKAG